MPGTEIGTVYPLLLKVCVWGDDGDSAVSETAFFETGKMKTSWSAKWITPNPDEEAHSLIRRSFVVPSPVAKARAYVCGLGLYEFEINDKRLAADLRKKLEANKMYLNTGFVGTAYLCRALSENGANDCAYTLFLNDNYPSWLYKVKLGATTVWERWNSILPDGKISGTGMNSLNHYAYGAIVEWMYRDMCGLNPMEDAPGFKKVKICPKPDQRVRQVSMSYQSASGLYKIGWNYLDENTVSFDFEIPFDAQALVILPQGGTVINSQIESGSAEFELEAGKYHFDYQLKRGSLSDETLESFWKGTSLVSRFLE